MNRILRSNPPADADAAALGCRRRRHAHAQPPAQFNAIARAMLAALQAALDASPRTTAVRVVVIAGAGRAFCAGHDLKEMLAHSDRGSSSATCSALLRRDAAAARLPQPVIARVHGIATAAGCQLVAVCDLAVAADDARFATSGINVGLFCSTPGVPVSRNIAAQARDRDAADRRVHRRADRARLGPRQPRRAAGRARRRGRARWRGAIAASRAACSPLGKRPSTSRSSRASPRRTPMRARSWRATCSSRTRRRASTRSSASAAALGTTDPR